MGIRLPSRIDESLPKSPDLGLLILRLGAGLLMITQHGLPKLLSYGEKSGSFSDPLGVTPGISLALAVFAEFFCSLAVALGLYTRLTVLPLLFTMGVAAFVVHATDPFKVKEKAFLFGLIYLVILISGPGKYALSSRFGRKRLTTT